MSALCCAAALSMISCDGNKVEDPALTAIKARVAASVGEGASVRINSFEKVDSVTYGQELEYRKNLFERKLEKTQELYDKYVGKHMVNNAKKKAEEIAMTRQIIEGLRTVEDNIKDSIDVVAYYDYKFSGSASNKVSEIQFDEYYASVSTSGEVLYLQGSQRGLHRTNGRILPGYMEILKGESEEAEE